MDSHDGAVLGGQPGELPPWVPCHLSPQTSKPPPDAHIGWTKLLVFFGAAIASTLQLNSVDLQC